MYLRKITVFFTAVLIAITAVMMYSCGGGGARKAVRGLSDVLRGNYNCEISFNIGGENAVSGTGQITRSGTVTRLDILSPEPYSGMSIEYDTEGFPQSVAVHFSGMSTTLPDGAVSRLEPLASLFADDFASSLAAVPKESITEYESGDTVGLCASLMHGDYAVDIYFSSDGSVPYAMTVAEGDVITDIVFDAFRAQETVIR